MAENAQLKIENGQILSFSYVSESLDTDFRFGRRKNLRIQCAAIDVNGTQHQVGACAKELDDLIAADDYCTLTINGVEVSTQAKLTSFAIEEGEWVRLTQATIGFVIYEEGNLEEQEYFSSEDYEDIKDLDKPSLAYIESFTEDFSFTTGANSLSYDHSASAKFSSMVGEGNPEGAGAAIDAAIEVCNTLLNIGGGGGGPSFDWLLDINFQGLYSGSIEKEYKRYLTENVDYINNTVTVQEKFEALNIAEGEFPYSLEAKQAVNLAEDGNITVTEKGTILTLAKMGADDVMKFFDDAEAGLEIEVENAVMQDGRLQNIFSSYRDNLVGCGAGEEEEECHQDIPDLVVDGDEEKVLKIKFGVTRNEFTGEIKYDITGTNDPKYKGGVIHEYTRTIQAKNYEGTDGDPVDGAYWLEIKEDGDIQGNGKKIDYDQDKIDAGEDGTFYPAYLQAKAEWDNVRGVIKQDLKDQIEESQDRYHISLTTKSAFYQGKFAYSISYGDHPKYGTTETPWKQLTYDVSRSLTEEGEEGGAPGGGDELTSRWVHQANIFDVYGHPAQIQIAQKRATRQLTSSGQSINAVGKRSATWLDLSKAIVEADPAIIQPSEEAMFLSSCSLTFNAHNNKLMRVNLDWR